MGPRTEEGKRRSAFNLFRHGLHATQDPTIRQAFDRSGVDLPDWFDITGVMALQLLNTLTGTPQKRAISTVRQPG
jgi:hypothetical protein